MIMKLIENVEIVREYSNLERPKFVVNTPDNVTYTLKNCLLTYDRTLIPMSFELYCGFYDEIDNDGLEHQLTAFLHIYKDRTNLLLTDR